MTDLDLPDDGWSAAGDGDREPPIADKWREAGIVHHGFTHFDLELAVLRCTGASEPSGEGEWWPVGELEQAGLPTLFAKAAQRALS